MSKRVKTMLEMRAIIKAKADEIFPNFESAARPVFIQWIDNQRRNFERFYPKGKVVSNEVLRQWFDNYVAKCEHKGVIPSSHGKAGRKAKVVLDTPTEVVTIEVSEN